MGKLINTSAVPRAQVCFDCGNHRIRGGSASRDAHRVVFRKPFGAQVLSGLNVMHASAMFSAGRDQFTGVVAVRATDDDDHVAALGEINGGALSVLRRLANGVNEAHVGLRELLANQLNQFADAFDGLRGLGDDSETRASAELHHVFRRKHNIELGEIIRHAVHFYMVVFADDDGCEPSATSFVSARCATWTSGQVASITFNPRPRVRLKVRFDVPCAVIITVGVPTESGVR